MNLTEAHAAMVEARKRYHAAIPSGPNANTMRLRDRYNDARCALANAYDLSLRTEVKPAPETP